MKRNKGITLIALVITIILLLILAGVVINLVVREHGIINLAKEAGKNYVEASQDEQRRLDELYSSILVATGDNAKITITQEDLRTLIQTEVRNYSPTGIKTDTYISGSRSDANAYSDVTSMNGFTRGTDEKNKINEYLTYSDETGYTVKKSGWYFVDMHSVMQSTTGANTLIYLKVNNIEVTYTCVYTASSDTQYADEAFPIFLSERRCYIFYW